MTDEDRDYYLPCGCWSGQADHTCQVGGWRRPWYCHCGAPDDCYCNEDGRYDRPEEEEIVTSGDVSRNVLVTRHGLFELTPEVMERARRFGAAWTDNEIHETRDAALVSAARAVSESGDLEAAAVWASGTGNWLVNGSRQW